MSTPMRTFGNAVANYGGFTASVVVVFFLTPLIVSALGVEGFGLWTLVFATVGLVGLLDVGLQTTTVKFVGEYKGRGDVDTRNRILSTIAALYGVVALGALALIGLLALSFSRLFGIPEDQQPTALLLVWILGARVTFLGLPLSLFRAILFGEQRIVPLNLIQGATTLAYGTVAWALLALGGDLVALAWVNLAAMVVEHALYAAYALRTVPGLRIAPSLVEPGLLARTLGFSGYQVVVNAAVLVRLRSDLFMIKLFLPLSAVGVYAVALKMAEQLSYALKRGVNVLAPVAAELGGAQDREALGRLFLSGTQYAFALALALWVLCVALGTEAIVAWVGPDFASSGPILVILAGAMVLATVEGVAASVLAMTGHHRATSRAALASAVVNIVVSLLLIRPYGIVGVAIGTLVAGLTIDLVLVPRLAFRAYGIRPMDFVRRVLVPAGLSAVAQLAALGLIEVAWAPRTLPQIGVASLASLLVFASCFWRLGIPSEDRAALRRHLSTRWGTRRRRLPESEWLRT